MRNNFIATLADVAAENPKIWLLSGDLGYSVLEPFAARFPDRYLNMGVAEQNMAGVAAGIALSGNTVFVYSIGNFPTLRCLEQIRNDICYHGADVKVVAVGAGYAYGSQGYTHHAIEDVAIMSTLPGMEVFVPCDPIEARVATQAIAASGRPSYLRLSRAGEPLLHSSPPKDLRRPGVLRQGRDVIIFASGPIASACLAAADRLATEDLTVGVLTVPCIKPFDDAFAREVANGARLFVTVEEHILRGGLHAGVLASLSLVQHRPPVLGLAIPEPTGKITKAGDREVLLEAAGLSAETIAKRVRSALAALS
jgi:transketolase